MEVILEDFFAVIKEISVAHKYEYNASEFHGYKKGRKSFGLVCILSGDIEYVFDNGERLLLGEGEVLLLKPTDAYSIICRDKCMHCTVNFKLSGSSIIGDAARDILQSEKSASERKIKINKYYTDVFLELCSVWREKSAGYRMVALSLAEKLLHNFLKTKITAAHTDRSSKLRPAKEFIESNWNKSFSLSDLAAVSNLSASHLRHLFSELYGTTPLAYRDSMRLLYAKDFLLDERLTIGEVADRCGFDDVNYFSRFFKKNTGLSPSEYRSVKN